MAPARDLKSAPKQLWNGPQTATSEDLSGSDLEAVRKGFMFISIEDELPTIDIGPNHNLINTNACNTFERRKHRNEIPKFKPEVSFPVQSTDTDEENQKLLQSSLLSCSKLGEDLLWLFLLQTDCDTQLLVDEGKRALGAHRCILAARSDFLRKQLSELQAEQIQRASIQNNQLQSNAVSSESDNKLSETDPLLSNRSNSFRRKFSDEKLNHNLIDCLIEFSFPAVHFALCHIYSGTVVLPNFVSSVSSPAGHGESDQMQSNRSLSRSNSSPTASIATSSATNSLPYTHVPLAELLHLCDLLQLPHLRQAVVLGVRQHLCHQFHSPCDRCVVGVCQAVQLAERCDLPSLHSTCIRWLAKHLPTICTHKAFVDLLSSERPLMQRKSQGANNLTNRCATNSIGKRPKLSVRLLETVEERINEQSVLDIGLALVKAQQHVNKHSQSEQLNQLLLHSIESCLNVLTDQFDVVLCSESFDRLLLQSKINPDTILHLFSTAIDRLDAERACRAACALEQLFALYDPNQRTGQTCFRRVGLDESQLHLLRQTRKQVEKMIVKNFKLAQTCESWSLLSAGWQRHLQEAAMLVFEFDKPIGKRPQLSSSARIKEKPNISTSDRIQSARDSKRSCASLNTNRKLRSEVKSAHSSSSRANDRLKNKTNHSTATETAEESEQDHHIYDEVPIEKNFESPRKSNRTVSSNDWTNDKRTSRPSLQIAKVSPFQLNANRTTNRTVNESEDTRSLTHNNVYENLRSDKEDDEAILSTSMNSLLQQADLLQKRLNQQINRNDTQPQQSSSSSSSSRVANNRNKSSNTSSQSTRSRIASSTTQRTSGSGRNKTTQVAQSLNRRPPFK